MGITEGVQLVQLKIFLAVLTLSGAHISAKAPSR